MYAALSTPRDAFVGSKPDLSIYEFFNDLDPDQDREVPITDAEAIAHYSSAETESDEETRRRQLAGEFGLESLLGDPKTRRGEQLVISVTTMGHILDDATPRFLILHGVPSNKKQWYPVAKYLALFGYVACFDMMGMGMSSKPRLGNPPKDWMWKHHLKYIRPLAKQLFGSVGSGPRPFIFISDDWGSGIHAHYAAAYPQDIERNAMFNPVAFDGYPVAEIEAIGRAHALPDEAFNMAMGAFDQTVLQIMKTMTYNPNATNQYNQRDLLGPYADKDYGRPGWTPSNKGLNFASIRVLSEMASALTPEQLLPYDPVENPEGVQYDRITKEFLVGWGEYDNMMPEPQISRFQAALANTSCSVVKIPRAGHFSGLDQPELVAEAILSWLNKDPSMRHRLNDVYFGLTGIWKGDERHVVKSLRALYGIDNRIKAYSFKRAITASFGCSPRKEKPKQEEKPSIPTFPAPCGHTEPKPRSRPPPHGFSILPSAPEPKPKQEEKPSTPTFPAPGGHTEPRGGFSMRMTPRKGGPGPKAKPFSFHPAVFHV